MEILQTVAFPMYQRLAWNHVIVFVFFSQENYLKLFKSTIFYIIPFRKCLIQLEGEGMSPSFILKEPAVLIAQEQVVLTVQCLSFNFLLWVFFKYFFFFLPFLGGMCFIRYVIIFFYYLYWGTRIYCRRIK